MKIRLARRFNALFGVAGILLFLPFWSCAPKNSSGRDGKNGLRGTVSISGAFALYPLAVMWSEEFKAIYPDVRFNISAGGAGKGIADALSGMVDIGLVSRDVHEQEFDRGAYVVHVAKDAVVGTVSARNPNLDAILARGLTQEELQKIFVTGTVSRWNEVDPSFTAHDLHVYVRSDAAGAAETWAAFFGKSQEDLRGIGIFGDPGVVQAIQQNPLAIGFNNINYVYDLKTRKQVADIRVIPIDVDGDGTIGPDEAFYGSIDSLTDAVARGAYPAPPARNLSFLIKGKPEDVVVVEFIRFVLTKKSQSILLENGYIPLNDEQLEEEHAKLN
ncbi:phosphate transport system substrate-binding protein [Parapedobacter composti]|uniref:Phosphate transport system substrate-binding protein n=1 Tax=Parapedobacter composti TaxID=623281 RepID=A0A1I1GBT5_9SPHI|nr:PstS family phosphate ABC transporter substrate-binding protein [Parapedobacter composti]SFC08876.1 phosphate transport system substrate-binding protein [Parapedobacter composti]